MYLKLETSPRNHTLLSINLYYYITFKRGKERSERKKA